MDDSDAAPKLSNEELQEAFHHVHDTVVNNISAASIIDTLFAKKVITANDMEDLYVIPHQTDKCRRLLILLHKSKNPDAFVQLRAAIRSETAHRWLVDVIDSRARYYRQTVTVYDRKLAESSWPGLRRQASASAATSYGPRTETTLPVKEVESLGDVVVMRCGTKTWDTQRQHLSWNCSPVDFSDVNELADLHRQSDVPRSEGRRSGRVDERSNMGNDVRSDTAGVSPSGSTEAMLALRQHYEDLLRQQRAEFDQEKMLYENSIGLLKSKHEKQIQRLSAAFAEDVTVNVDDRGTASENAADKEAWPRLVSNPVHVSLTSNPIGAISSLNGELFLVRRFTARRVEVYDMTIFKLQREISVRRLGNVSWGLATSAVDNCLFVSDWCNRRIHRVKLYTSSVLRHLSRRRSTAWRVDDENPMSLSMSRSGHVLVTCWSSVREYDTVGVLVRRVTVHREPEVGWLQHAIELDGGNLVVTEAASTANRVCLLTSDGTVGIARGGGRGSATGQFDSPSQLVVDRNGFVLVADRGNDRIIVLNPSLSSSCELNVAIDNGVMRGPETIHLDESRNRLYVGESRGRFLVFEMSP